MSGKELKKKKKSRKAEERIEQLDWYMFIVEFFLYIPRVLWRMLRRFFDWS